VVPARAAVGGGGAPGVELPSAAVSLPEALGVLVRRGEPAVVGRLEGGRLLLDLRSVPPEADSPLVAAVLAGAQGLSP
jgi:L-seryl-tRNA(Ser) seleniumtransferase